MGEVGERILRFLELGIEPGRLPADVMRRVRILSAATLALSVVAIPTIYRFCVVDLPQQVAAVAIAMGAAVGNLVLLRATGRAELCGHLGLFALTVLLLFSIWATGGFYDPNFAWFYLIPICAAVMVGLRGAAAWTLATLMLTVGFWVLPDLGIDLVTQVPQRQQPGQALFSRVSAVLTIALIGVSFVVSQRRSEHDLARANEELFRETAFGQLLMQAAVSANEATSFDQALREAMDRICTTMGWEVGHVCELDDDGQLVSAGAFHRPDRGEFAVLEAATARARYAPGVGLPGRALASKLPQRVDDFNDESLMPRASMARDAGLRSAFAVPVMVSGEVRAVLEFASRDRLPDDERLLDVFSHIGVQLGRVAERTALQARVRQSQKMEAVGQLAAGLAHEINNPMSYVRTNLHMLKEEWKDLRSEVDGYTGTPLAAHFHEIEELIDDSLEGVERTISIVRDVRDFSHTGGVKGATWATADLADLLEGALRVAQTHAPAGVTVERAYADAPRVRCAHNQLQQVFVNLLVNAFQAVGETGRIRLVTGVEGPRVFVRIEDDGPGVPAEVRDRLFDPFFTTKGVGEGTGLGLYVSYEIVRGHGGEIAVTSEPGAGTSFEVRVPIDAE